MFGVALLTIALLALADARIYERCELARDLLSFGIKREHLATWVCIAFHESRFDTAARNPYSGDHGLLQISELYWCGAGKACSLPCSALRDDDISDDIECALRVHEEHTRLQGNGFLAWVVYPQHCRHNAKKYLANCESLVKTPSVRTNGRARVLKSQNRNVTYVSNNPKIDELLPPYLTIGSIFRGNYEKEFEQNYNNKIKIDWLSYKFANIDNLKLPVFNEKVIETFTTTTLATTTTTSSSPLPKIKPPSPRRIESNSFRRRKMRPIFEAVKLIETTDPAKITTPRNIYISSTKNPVIQEKLPQFETVANIPILTSTTTVKPLTNEPESTTSVKPFTSPVIEEQTTRAPITYTVNPVQTTIIREVSTEITNISLPTIPSADQSLTMTLINQSLSVNKSRILFSEIKKTLSPSPSGEPISTVSANSTSPTVAVKANPLNFMGQSSSSTTSRPWSWRTWTTTLKYNAIMSTTSKPPTLSWWTAKTTSNALAKTNKDMSTTQSKPQSTTSNPWTKYSDRLDLKTTSTKLLDFKYNTSSTRIPLVESTTPKPDSTTPTVTSRSTTNTEISTSSSTELSSPTTVKTTQSIFDLYLNPTKRPKRPAFSLPPFKSGNSLRIFASGTTTHAPVLFRSEGRKSALKESTNNQIIVRRQAWQPT